MKRSASVKVEISSEVPSALTVCKPPTCVAPQDNVHDYSAIVAADSSDVGTLVSDNESIDSSSTKRMKKYRLEYEERQYYQL